MFNFFDELKTRYNNCIQKINPYQIVMMGDFLLYFEGELTLMTLTTENVVLKVKDGVITISGKKLQLKDISSNTITIVGKIEQLERI